MAKRHRDAVMIQVGACNPSGIALSIVDACKEMRENPATRGTDTITNDPAVRLMVHQLAYICNAYGLDDLTAYGEAINVCKLEAEKEAP